MSEARVAEQPAGQGQEVQASPEVPVAAAELPGSQKMEGKQTKLGKNSLTWAEPFPAFSYVSSLLPTGFFLANMSLGSLFSVVNGGFFSPAVCF